MEDLSQKKFYKQFPNEEACLEYLEKIRWPDGPICPHCGSINNSYRFKSRGLFKCKDCTKQYTVKVGTIFSDSHISLQDWFQAIYVLTSLKKGISSVQLSKYLELSQKSAWFMLHRIRYAMEYNTLDKPLDGPTAGDETVLGGKTKKVHRNQNKTIVLGLVETKKKTGKVSTRAADGATAHEALQFIRENVAPGSLIYTDESIIYSRLHREYPHESINHARGEYGRGVVTTNQLEGAWTHLKLMFKSTYMSRPIQRHVKRYLTEFDYRYNTRDLKDGERFERFFKGVDNRHLSYKQLIG